MRAPLLPKLRGHFAEFLNHSSLVRLGILYLTTCVGLGYGPCVSSLEAFLGSRGSPNSPHPAMHHLSDLCDTRICLGVVLPVCPSITTDWYGYLPASPHRLPTTTEDPTQPPTSRHPKVSSRRGFGWLVPVFRYGTATHGYGNINPLSIDYACRPRLRSRLTLGGLAWPRNPWSFGGQGSHLPYRYSCLHSHSPPLHHRSPGDFAEMGTLPYPTRNCLRIAAASAVCLSPATLSAHNHLTSELLRTLSRVAASKPTSWLSSRLHILFHLAHA